MTTPATQQPPGPDSEAQPAVGHTGEELHALPMPGPGEVGEKPEHLPTLVLPDLRPYVDPKAVFDVTRRTIKASRRPASSLARRTVTASAAGMRHVAVGTAALLRLLIGWLTGEYGKHGSRMARIGGVAAVLLGVVHTLADYPGEGVGGLVLLWLTIGFAHRAGALDKLVRKVIGETPKRTGKATEEHAEKAPTKDADEVPAPRREGLARWLRKKPAPVPESTPAETPVEEPTQYPVEDVQEPPLTALIRELIGSDTGVHLQVLRPAMRERFPALSGATDQQLRKVLLDADWDPSRKFRARGFPGRAGIHRDQLPPLSSPGDGQGAETKPLSVPKSASDLHISPPTLRRSPGVKSGEERHRKVPEGWTGEDVDRGYRWVNDAERGPSAWTIERLRDE
ncbi:hypothetical protein QFZ66_005855 [Streptomyces sp. B4I13]|uniref:hypothetical protein n=1 Tax=Streptomyces sp. B4I13 TaxID=3042271 RepID=UPI00278A546E|nr:hypothetical protein [Streptomyces sp. B4I13]MDQ0961977.1 hypothetical protein [Streptomyces sp. B4I13]